MKSSTMFRADAREITIIASLCGSTSGRRFLRSMATAPTATGHNEFLMNGIQAMKPVTDRRRQLLIRSREHGSDQTLVRSRIRIGIEPENARSTFNAFFTTKPDGMGIGYRSAGRYRAA